MIIFEIAKRYKKSYKNWMSVMISMKLGKDNINVITLKGDRYKAKWRNVSVYTVLVNEEMDYNKAVESFQGNFYYKDYKFKLSGYENIGDIPAVFINEEYKFLSVKNEYVIDIGANIGDSAIYFALNDAKKVIALEPYPYSFDFAVKNVEQNNLKDKITVLNAGYGKDGKITVDKNKITDAGSELIESKEGKEINVYSLKTLLDNYGIKEAILKMDCEGCEYNLLNEDVDTLKKFKRIQIEYHYGYKNLKDRLEECNFEVKYTEPNKSHNKCASNPNMFIGYIYASRK
jgi:FkbM family methyltransferase